eukprot:5258182-Pyramimonas_sp.AAC.1
MQTNRNGSRVEEFCAPFDRPPRIIFVHAPPEVTQPGLALTRAKESLMPRIRELVVQETEPLMGVDVAVHDWLWANVLPP